MRQSGYYWVKPKRQSQWCVAYYDHDTSSWEIFQATTRGGMEPTKSGDGMWQVGQQIKEPTK